MSNGMGPLPGKNLFLQPSSHRFDTGRRLPVWFSAVRLGLGGRSASEWHAGVGRVGKSHVEGFAEMPICSYGRRRLRVTSTTPSVRHPGADYAGKIKFERDAMTRQKSPRPESPRAASGAGRVGKSHVEGFARMSRCGYGRRCLLVTSSTPSVRHPGADLAGKIQVERDAITRHEIATAR